MDAIVLVLQGLIIYNWLFGLNQFSAFPFFYVFIFWFKTPSYDKNVILYFLLIIAKHCIVIGKVSNAWIKLSFSHWLFRQKNKRSIHFKSYSTSSKSSGQTRGNNNSTTSAKIRHGIIGLHGFNFNSYRVTINVFYITSFRRKICQVQCSFSKGVDTYNLVITIKEIG